MTTQKGLPARATDDVIAEVQRRLDTFHSPSFDREIVEQLLALARRSALASLTTGEGGGEAMVEIGARAICEADDCAWNSTEAAKASYRKQARACLNAALSPAPAGR